MFPISERFQKKVWEEEDLGFAAGKKHRQPRSERASASPSPASKCQNRGRAAAFELPLKKRYLDQLFSEFHVDV